MKVRYLKISSIYYMYILKMKWDMRSIPYSNLFSDLNLDKK